MLSLPRAATLTRLSLTALLCSALAGHASWAQQAVAAASAASAASASTAAADDAAARFDILEFVIEGNTVLPVADIERAVMPFLGERKLIADVEHARKALEDEYQRLGYQTVFVDVPEQRVGDGTVHLRVVEGRVERLHVTGNHYFSQGVIRATVPSFAEGSVPDFNAVQTQLGNLNRTGDRQITPVLRPGRTPGTVEVELAVKDQAPVHGDIELNNRSSAFTSESRLNAGLHWDNLWQAQHSAGLSVQTSPQARNEVKVLVGNYLWRMADSPDVVALYAVRSDSQVALVGESTILGNAKIAGARWVRPLPSSAAEGGLFQSITFGIDYKNFAQTTIATATNSADVLGALHYVPLSLAYSATLNAPGKSSQFNVSAFTAPSGIFGNSDAQFKGRRIEARAGWTVLKFDATLERAITERTSAWFKMEGQFSDVPLISNEQLTMGGAESVRGYREAELAGDRGGRGSLELRWWPWRPSAADLQKRAVAATPATPGAEAAAAPATPSVWSDLQLYTLLDVGAVQTVQAEGSQLTRRLIGGAGAGLRWAQHGWHAQVEAARALKLGGTGLNGYITHKGDTRVHARLGFEF